MRKLSLVTMVGSAAALVAMTAQAGLVPTDGGLGVYDTVNNVTWTSNANLFLTQAASYSGGTAAFVSAVIADSGGVIHDTPNIFDPSGTYTLSASDFVTSGSNAGTMDWWGAKAWVNYLDATDYGGSNQWALPTTINTSSRSGCGASCNFPPAQSSSQLAQLFYGGLGQVAGSRITTTHNANYSLFSNVQSAAYWSGTDYSFTPNYAWYFLPSVGAQDALIKTNDLYALAVSPGQISAVPLPAAAWMLAGGLLGLLGLRRRRSKPVVLKDSIATQWG